MGSVILLSINKRVKQVRKFLKLSQAEFAKNLCLSGGYFAGIEMENRRANDRIIRLICVTYGVNEEWLRTASGKMFDRSTDAKQENAQKLFRDLRSEYQDHALNLIQDLLKIQEMERERLLAEQKKSENAERQRKYFTELMALLETNLASTEGENSKVLPAEILDETNCYT